MKCIKVITDEDFGLKSIPFKSPRQRFGARGIVINSANEIAIVNKQAKNEYKLAGGGIEENEDPKKAFQREVLEETGCKIKVNDCLGIIKEEKSQDNFIQTSYVFVAHVLEDTKHLNLTQQEINEEAQLLWLGLNNAMKVIKECEEKILPSKFESNMSVYHTKFIVRRDYEILKYFYQEYFNFK